MNTTEEEEVDQILWEQRKKELAAEEMFDALVAAWKTGAFDGDDEMFDKIAAALEKAGYRP